jgi:phospholipase/lecithinase/hemolysin
MATTLLRRCALLLALAGASITTSAQPYSDLFVFGDSLTDSGNAFLATSNVAPLVPVLPAPPYFQGRFSNGYNFADDLSLRLFGKPTLASFATGNNFAVGGATTGTANNVAPIPTGLRIQAADFLRTRASNGADPNALYLVYGGSNDLIAAIGDVRNGTGDPTLIAQKTVRDAMDNLGSIITDLSDKGAQHFLVPNLPDIGKVPSFLGAGALSTFASQASTSFNAALATLLQTFPTLDIHTLDVHGAFDAARAGAYGFGDTTTPCYAGGIAGGIPPVPCADPDNHLFWDDLHPTARTHAILADLAYAAAVPEPRVWMVLLAGMLLTCVGARRARMVRSGA